MKSIYSELSEQVYNGEKFNVNFEKRSIKVGGKYLIKDGEYDKDKYVLFTHLNEYGINDVLKTLDDLYMLYKYSTPSERSENKRHKYFKALSTEEMTDEQLVCGMQREVAQSRLEAFILCSILNGNLTWQDEWGTFFYQGNDPDFILLKKWIVK